TAFTTAICGNTSSPCWDSPANNNGQPDDLRPAEAALEGAHFSAAENAPLLSHAPWMEDRPPIYALRGARLSSRSRHVHQRRCRAAFPTPCLTPSRRCATGPTDLPSLPPSQGFLIVQKSCYFSKDLV